MINSVTVAGNLTKDAEVRQTASGMAVVSFGIAVNERRKNSQTGEWSDYPNYFDCVAFGDRWGKLAQYLRKGSKVTVQGHLRYNSWEKDGAKRSKVDIVVDEVELPPKPRQASEPEYVEASVYDDEIPFD